MARVLRFGFSVGARKGRIGGTRMCKRKVQKAVRSCEQYSTGVLTILMSTCFFFVVDASARGGAVCDCVSPGSRGLAEVWQETTRRDRWITLGLNRQRS